MKFNGALSGLGFISKLDEKDISPASAGDFIGKSITGSIGFNVPLTIVITTNPETNSGTIDITCHIDSNKQNNKESVN